MQAGVVDHNVDTAEPFDRRRDSGVHPIGIGNVAVHSDRLSPCIDKFGRGAFGHFDVDVGDNHTGTLGDQRPRECPAETDRAASNHRRAAIESHNSSSVGYAAAVVSVVLPAGNSDASSMFTASRYSGRVQNPEWPQTGGYVRSAGGVRLCTSSTR